MRTGTSSRHGHGTRWHLFLRTIAVFVGFSILALLPASAIAQAADYTYRGDIHFNIARVPFSRYGSYLAISNMSSFEAPYQANSVFLRTIHGGGQRAFQIQLTRDGKVIPFTASATPVSLILTGGGGEVDICFQGPDRLRFRGQDVQLRLISIQSWAVSYPHNHWEVTGNAMKYMLWPVEGEMKESTVAGKTGTSNPALTFAPASGSGNFQGELDAYTSAWLPHSATGSFDQVEAQEKNTYSAWLKTMPSVPASLGAGAELAAYIDWESIVNPDGNLKRPAMLMSKNWMSAIWSWDQTFNAMAMSLGNPALAWDQFLLPIDVQNKIGAFPDKWDADSIAWEFSKPPVHGWALEWMLQHGHFDDPAHLRQVYEPLVKWTNWYLTYRDANGDGLPNYRQGDESGWDNSTVFRNSGLIESPDLSAYLVVQMDALSDIARRLGMPKQAGMWQDRATILLHKMLHKFWTGHRFVAFRVHDGRPVQSESLLLDMPIILGRRLPPDIRRQMVEDIRKRMKDSLFGLPSEPTTSPFYQSDGYWRGPIWAPSTAIIVNGLDSIGEQSLANSLRMKFCLMAQRSGMSENFDAETGKGLRDPAYTWTSSVYLIFAHQLAIHGSN